MAVNISIYSNANSSSKTVTVDFIGDVLASSNVSAITGNMDYFFKFTTGARTDINETLPTRVTTKLSDLVLNKQKQRANNFANAYTSVKTMIVDYVYDYIYGHSAGQWGTTVRKQDPMGF
jgi:hypothetical protein